MKWTRWQAVPAVARDVLEHLTAIRLHSHAVRRRLRRSEPAARAEALDHVDAIEEHVDRAAARIETLGARGQG